MIQDLAYLFFIMVGAVAAAFTKKLTLAGAIAGGLIGTIIYAGVGWMGIVLLGTFFIIGTACTSYKKSIKQQLGIAQDGGSRTAGQVLANGGAAALTALLALLIPQQKELFLLMVTGALSAATADTVSSELGSVHGKKFYDILTLNKGVRGRDGVISLEGLLFGITGSGVIALIYSIEIHNYNQLIAIIIAGTIGNLVDSYLGATLERKQFIGNNTVNFLNTAIGALAMLLLAFK